MLTKLGPPSGIDYEIATGQRFRTRPTTEEEIVELVSKELSIGDPRSEAYRRGVTEILRTKIFGSTFPAPYKMGTAEADAYYAGRDRGYIVFRTLEPESRTSHGSPKSKRRGDPLVGKCSAPSGD